MKRIAFFLLMAVATVACVSAQSNEFMDRLLGTKAVTAGDVSCLVLVATDKIGEDADGPGAFGRLVELGWAPPGSTAAGAVRLSGYAYILTRAFGLQGGVMYTLFPGPRYAYRELVSRHVIQGRTDPDDAVDGVTAVRLLGRVLDITEARQ